jgi:multicomponent Na+:H+ antiporter subunit E
VGNHPLARLPAAVPISVAFRHTHKRFAASGRATPPGIAQVIHALSFSLSLMTVWLLWSGHYTALLVGLGVVSCLAVTLLARRMLLADPEGHAIHLAWRTLLYLPWLAWVVTKSNIEVALLILSPSMKIKPRIVRVRATQHTDVGRVVYANSITLTPGTVTVDVEGDLLSVHALTDAAAEELKTGGMDRRVTRMEGAD